MKIPNTILFLTLTVFLAGCVQKSAKKEQNTVQKADSATAAVMTPPEKSSIDSGRPESKRDHSSTLIVPGQRIGQISLGETMDQIFSKLDRPDSSDASMSSAVAIWYAGHDKAGYKTSVFSSLDPAKKDDITQYAKRILITSPYFKTAEGLGVNSTIEQIREHHSLKIGSGNGEKLKDMAVYNDLVKGIAFEIDPSSRKCIGVIIQKPGVESGSYLNLN